MERGHCWISWRGCWPCTGWTCPSCSLSSHTCPTHTHTCEAITVQFSHVNCNAVSVHFTQCLPLHSLVSHLHTQPLTMHTYNICIGIAMLQYCSRPGHSTLCHSWHSTHSLCCPSTLSRSETNEGLKVSHFKKVVPSHHASMHIHMNAHTHAHMHKHTHT